MHRLLLLILLVCTTVASAQIKISGVITSEEDKEPLIGASILVKGTTIGTITNLDGAFELSVPENAVLVVSFIGMITQQIPIGSQTTFNIILKSEAVALKEVVVVAYGTQRKDRFNGSISTLKSEDIAGIPSASVDKMLQGNVPGLLATSASGQPGSATEIRIRGTGSILASNEPLYVIDGVPVESGSLGKSVTTSNPLSLINPNDIESISVLKDAASASLYGSRAANGVILITTKQGKKGATKFNLSTTQGVTSKATDNYHSLTAQEYVNLRRASLQNAGFQQNQIDQLAGSAATNTNWASEVYHPALFSEYELSANGGDEKTTFFISGSYLDQDGIVIGSSLKRGTARVNLTHQATEKLKIGINTNLSYSLQNTPTGGGSFSNPVLAADLIPSNVAVKNDKGEYNYDFAALNGQNPVGLAKININELNTTRGLNNAFLEYKIIPGLVFKTNWGVDYIDGREKYFMNPYYGDGASSHGIGQRYFNRKISWLTSNTLKYNKKINEIHSFEALVGYEAQSYRKDFASMVAQNFPSDRLSELDVAAQPTGVGSSVSKSTYLSYLAQVLYNFKEKYSFSASGRRDGSSRFGVDNRYANFYSVGASWRLNEEEFLKEVQQINSLKLRSSYGTSGNSEINDYQSRGLYGFTNYYGNPAMYPTQMANKNLTWEKNKIFNIGLDARVYNRFTFSLEYYNRTTSDLLLNVPVSSTTGYSFIYQNVGSMVNKGWEFSLTTENLKGDLTWLTSFNFTFNKNEITKLNNNEDIIDANGIQIKRVGEDFSSFYLRKWAGVNPADGSPMWYDKNGNIVYDSYNAQRVIAGSSAPKIFGGINNTFSWKSLDLSFLFIYNYGNKIYDNWANYTESDGRFLAYNQNADQLNYWKNPGDIVSVPKPIFGNSSGSSNNSTRYMHDGSYIRLRTLSLGYSLPKRWIEKMKLNQLRLSLTGQNLWTYSRYKGHDVERSTSGLNDAAYPNVKTLSFKLDLSF